MDACTELASTALAVFVSVAPWWMVAILLVVAIVLVYWRARAGHDR